MDNANIFTVTITPTSAYSKARFFETSQYVQYWCIAGEDKNDSAMVNLSVAYYDVTLRTNDKCSTDEFRFNFSIARGLERIPISGRQLEKCKAQFNWTSTNHSLMVGDFFEAIVSSVDEYKYETSPF